MEETTMREFLETYWQDIVDLFDKIYAYIKEWFLANEEEAE